MRWALTQLTNELHYWTLDKGQYTADLKYNTQAASFRLASADKRLFFIERTGFLQSKYLLKTEYSIVAGEVHPGKTFRSGLAFIGNKKFHYSLTHHLLAFTSKAGTFSTHIECNDIDNITPTEIYALLFSTLRVVTQQVPETANLELA